MRISIRKKFYAPDAAGANNSGPAAPNAGTADTGANDAGSAAQQQQQQQQTPMSLEDRSAAAAARRQAEAQYKGQIATLQRQQEDLAKSRGFASFQEMVEYNSNELLQKGQVNQTTLAPLLNKLVQEHPAIQQAQAMVEATGVEHSLQEFKTAFPDAGIAAVEDFTKLPNFKGFYDYVDKGLSYVEAYKLSHESDILAKRTGAVRQQTLNNMNGKGHLTETQGAAEDGEVSVPDETMAYYRNFFPNWSEKQIRTHYGKQQKG